jgi:hypothetical protein
MAASTLVSKRTKPKKDYEPSRKAAPFTVADLEREGPAIKARQRTLARMVGISPRLVNKQRSQMARKRPNERPRVPRPDGVRMGRRRKADRLLNGAAMLRRIAAQGALPDWLTARILGAPK